MSSVRGDDAAYRPLIWRRNVRAWPDNVVHLWRRSLRFRTIAVTLVLSTLAILIAVTWTALAIQDDLFASRRDEVLLDAQRATIDAQTTLDSADTQGESSQIQSVWGGVRTTLYQQSSSDMIATFRIGEPSAAVDFSIGDFDTSIISEGLRQSVQADAGQQWWQSVALDASGTPGIVVGQQLIFPQVGAFEVYFAYDLAGASQTLGFVQATLWVVGVALVVLIGVIAWFVLRSVTTPIGEAALTSAKLASGDLAVRLPVRGEDELATLGQSFNAMADSIEKQIKELADLSLVQQRFVSDVSHELRTPLTTIRLAADMLNDRREEFDPATARAAELLSAQVERFEVLLGDLLEISRYDAGSVQLELEPTSLAQLAEDVIGQMEQVAEQHGSEVRVVAPGGYSPVDMDPRRVRRILRNLVGNAIEHGEGKPIVVTVDSNQNAVAVGVRDFGMGIREEHLEHVFDRFWRADPSRKRTLGGTGLGLAISLGDARLHGGDLTVWSRPGAGSHFVLTLPRHAAGLNGPSPIRLDPGEEGTLESFEHTQPIVTVRPAEHRPDAPEEGGVA
ncbi:two-component system sensor histidine kinase MtrB [Microbacterium sediminicola]|uniref:Sensor histidine kinase MtrB n=1 Tax=Microbacterium sediminicola TaxID=415210 RepID=A0ABP4TK98_9MICO